MQAWLKENKRYRWTSRAIRPDADPVNVFVFDRDEGFCEQIASTMALMLRASGVPTRVVTGSVPASRNVFTGYWEVRNADAHAWVEVLYPGYGWMPYDPTFGVPLASAANTTFMLAPLSKITQSVPAALRQVTDIARSTVDALPGPRWVGTVGLFGLVIVGVVLRRSVAVVARHRNRDPGNRAIDAWLAVERALKEQGLRREAHETAAEFAERVAPIVDVDVGGSRRCSDRPATRRRRRAMSMRSSAVP